MITYGMYVNNNSLIIYNEIPTFIIDLLNYQVTLINMMVLVTSKLLQSTLNGNTILWFPLQPYNTLIPNILPESKNKESINNKKDALQNENDNTMVQSIVREVNLQEITQQNKVLIIENNLLKSRISVIKSKEETMIENYEIEKMTVEAMQKYLKLLEDDYNEVIREGDIKI